jgi:hypothetical protein
MNFGSGGGRHPDIEPLPLEPVGEERGRIGGAAPPPKVPGQGIKGAGMLCYVIESVQCTAIADCKQYSYRCCSYQGGVL